VKTLASDSTSAPATGSEVAHFHQNIDLDPAHGPSTARQPGDLAVKINLLAPGGNRTRPSARTHIAKQGRGTPKPKRRWRIVLSLLLASIAAAGAAWYCETQTSTLQAKFLSRYAAGLQYHVEEGESGSLIFPQKGPFDNRLGYIRMPEMLATLKEYGLIISRQARFSDSLRKYAQQGFYIPYREKSQAGLQILDASQRPMYRMTNPRHVYTSFDEIPKVVVESLLFIENRDLLSDKHPKVNPAVDWGRFTKAVALQAGEQVNIHLPSMGGSTLATQIEKYRHSDNGLTTAPVEKLLQMASASVRAYRNGEDTSAYRKQLVLDYLNSVPLSAAPGAGEVNGLGDGLYVWFGTDFQEMNRLLHDGREGSEGAIGRKAVLLKQVISLMIAHRRPSYYLVDGRTELTTLTNKYLRVLTQNGIITAELSDVAQVQPLFFRNFKENSATPHVMNDKGVDVVRNRLAPLLGTSLYQLDRMDLTVISTLNSELQNQVGRYLKSLQDPEIAAEKGLIGKNLLIADQADEISYSFTLFERTPSGNKVRVQTDTTGLPFNINEGSKLELGSTAKLRTLATYLEVIAELHRKLSGLSVSELHKLQQQQPDILTFWVCSQLLKNRNIRLRELLDAAMQRPYSANPGQRFFTGGGIHTFGNFKKEDNRRIVTVAEALQSSINLPFVRIMQDIVNHTRATQWENPRQVLSDDKDSRREAVLTKFIDKESKVFLTRFWNKYKGKTADERLETLLTGMKPIPLRLTIVHRHLLPQADEAAFIRFIRSRVPTAGLSDKKLSAMYEKYRPGAYNLQDMGYLAFLHPVELWLLDYLQQPGEKSLDDAIRQSEGVRREVYGWLMRTRAKNARNSRVRTVLEIDAFSDIHRRWKNLGYPFDHLVPSLATALGSSGDRPAALAELIAIILNDGQRYPTHRLTRLEFARNTPYETIVEHSPARPVQVMEPEVARVLKEVLGQVVSKGTAQRLRNTFLLEEGHPLPVGGKTGTGDNRIVASTSSGYKTSSRALNRTATFVFYLGDHHFGTLTAFVTGRSAETFSFTSALPLQVLKGMAPILLPEIRLPAQGGMVRAAGGTAGEREG
jgi:membrane peptidoglycan carboxypeptidase